MPQLTASHLDDWTLLRFAAGDLDEETRAGARRHLDRCDFCSKVLGKWETLDRELGVLLAPGGSEDEVDDQELPPDDPFRRRPIPAPKKPGRGKDRAFIPRAVAASEEGMTLREPLLEAGRSRKEWTSALEGLDLSRMTDRYGLLYALQEAGRRIAESSARARVMAEVAIERLRRERPDGSDTSDADKAVPVATLLGQAHLLAGQGFNWTAEYDSAGVHFQVAFQAFDRIGDDFAVAHVELCESQRRSFEHRGLEALVLVRRAAAIFEEFQLEDFVARAAVVEGLALHSLGRDEEAVACFREALPIFERLELWSNYVGAVNSSATSLVSLKRTEEARQEYARALRHMSAETRRWMPFLRFGLARTLHVDGRFGEAAVSFGRAARLFAELGMEARALTAWLMEIESWARGDNFVRARRRMEIFRVEAERHRVLEPSAIQLFEEALGGQQPDLDRFARLRESVEATLQETLSATA